MTITEDMFYRGISRVWHIALLAGSVYVAANPKYAWAIPLFQALGSSTDLK
jgi:hypothetical protein